MVLVPGAADSATMVLPAAVRRKNKRQLLDTSKSFLVAAPDEWAICRLGVPVHAALGGGKIVQEWL